MLVIEDVLAQAAQRLALPAHVVRERNFYRDGDATHYGQVVDQAARLHTIWTRAAGDQPLRRAARGSGRASTTTHPHVKRGLAITPQKFGISFTAAFFNQAGALVLVYRDGSVQVNHGGTEMGQGLFTKIRQIAADGLGVDARRRPRDADAHRQGAEHVGHGGLGGHRPQRRRRGRRVRAAAGAAGGVAAALLDADPAAVHFDAGPVAAGARSLPFAELCEAAYRQRVPLFAQGFYRTPDIHFDPQTGRGKPFHYFSYGAAVSEVEVDGFTGACRLLRTDILQDVGDSISPIIDRGQIEGGFLQGVGWLTIEELLWDDRGRVATSGASTYKLPSWSEVPDVFVVDFLPGATQPGVVVGQQGHRRAAVDARVVGARGDPRRRRGVPPWRGRDLRQPGHARARVLRACGACGRPRGARMSGTELVRAAICHTPANPFVDEPRASWRITTARSSFAMAAWSPAATTPGWGRHFPTPR